MKHLLLSFTALFLTVCTFAQKKADDIAKFTTETIDLGSIPQNQPATAVFEVTNIGKEPLLIETANPTCGCTISDFTKTPIEPGKVGTIKATYNAKNLNAFEKHLTVKFAGVDDMKSITIKGNVIAGASDVPADKANGAVKDLPKEDIVTDAPREDEAKKANANNAKKGVKSADKKSADKINANPPAKNDNNKKLQDKKPQ